VGLPLIGDVSQLFDIGVARIEEIIIGASSAVLVHSLLFPRALKSQMDAKLDARPMPVTWSGARCSRRPARSAHAIENLRVEAAREMIDAGNLALSVIAEESGFGDPERMRRAFLRSLGHPPQSMRRMARQNAAVQPGA
jgi:AraC-like DNA-binding protein